MSDLVPSRFRVLALITDGFGRNGGIAEYNRQFLCALAESSLIEEVIVLSRLKGMSSQVRPLRLLELSPIRNRLAYSVFALRMAMTNRIDIVFCGHIRMTPLAATIAKLIHKPLWVQVHGIEAWGELSWPHRASLESATLVTSVSRYTRHRLLAWIGLDPARVKVLPNTVDPCFRPKPKPALLLSRYDLHGKKVLLTVSRLASSERYKGHDRVIRALPQVLHKYPRAAYLIVGEGDDRTRLEDVANEVGVRDKVHFAGLVAPEELSDHYCLADVFVMPSTGEGFGIALLEAMAAGVRVIGGNRDGSVDPLADGALGTLVDPDNGCELTQAICTAMAGRPAEVDCHTRFNIREFRTQVEAILSSILPLGSCGNASTFRCFRWGRLGEHNSSGVPPA
jgi:phosphatidyl-myo-inositol dimannoside synthase